MSKLKVDEFVDLVKKSGLIDDDRLSQALSGVDQSVQDSGIVASILTKADLLTEWQSEKLLEGRHKGFYLGKFKLLKLLGAGMGAVYLAEHKVMRHRVAIKCLPKNFARQTSYLERFVQEARASAQLHHPNMVRAHDVDNDGDNWYIVMDYIQGDDIQKIVSRSGPLDYRTAADYTRQAANGLAYAHKSGLVHRDIKPANLLVDKEGTVKILDMGLARVTDESQGSLTVEYDQKMIGTVDYLAPEQALDSHNADARADIYSLGCTLYFMLSGDAPFPKGTIPQRLMQHQSAEPPDVRDLRPDAPASLLSICSKMMAKSPRDRFQSAEEASATLQAWLNGESIGLYSRSSYVPPPSTGPSLNENLMLADLDEAPTGGPPSATRSGATSGAKPAAKPPSSVIAGQKSSPPKSGESGVKRDASAGKSGTGKPSTIQGGAGKPGGSAVSGTSSTGNGAAPPVRRPQPKPPAVQPLPELSAPSPMDDDLLSAAALPSADTLPLASIRRQQEEERQSRGLPMWLLIPAAVVLGLLVAGILAYVMLP